MKASGVKHSTRAASYAVTSVVFEPTESVSYVGSSWTGPAVG